MSNPYLPPGVSQDDIDRLIEDYDDLDYVPFVSPPVPACPVCLDELGTLGTDTVRCETCNKLQHRACAVLVGEDWYCREAHALAAALVAFQDAATERDQYKAALIRTVALGDVSAAIEGLVATSGETTLLQQLQASIEVVRQRKGEAA